MDTRNQIGTKRPMHGAVPGEAVHALEMRRPDLHIEVAFTAFAMPRMPPVAFAVIHNTKLSR